MKKKWIIPLIAACLISGCSVNTEVQAPELMEPVGVNIDTVTVKRGTYENLSYYEGSVVPSVSELCFPADGKIDNVYAYPGKWVEAGEELVSLDSGNIQEELDDLDAQIEDTVKEGEFSERLADIDLQMLQVEHQQAVNAGGYWCDQAVLLRLRIEQKTLEKTQETENRASSLEKLQAKRAELENSISDQVITAPHAGHVYFENTLKKGAYVRSGKPVIYVTDPANLYFRTESYVSDSDLEKHKHYVMIGGENLDVTVQPLDPDFFREALAAGKTIMRGFDFDPSVQKKLTAGNYGALIVKTAEIPDVLTVPENAVKHDSEGYYVYVIVNGSREKRLIELGQHNGIDRIVTSGLKEGEVVYVQD